MAMDWADLANHIGRQLKRGVMRLTLSRDLASEREEVSNHESPLARNLEQHLSRRLSKKGK